MTEGRGPYYKYVHELGILASDVARGAWKRVEQDVRLALNDQAAERVRELVPLATRRSQGAFFTTGRALDSFRPLIHHAPASQKDDGSRYWDPACGAGDLLLAASVHLPVSTNLPDTLRFWARRLRGSDLQPEFVETTRLRLFLAAAYRLREASSATPPTTLRSMARPSIFRSIRVEDGSEALRSRQRFTGSILLNPPYGLVQPDPPYEWATGAVSQAATFSLEAAKSLALGHKLVAILPDVLRSGSRYERWRELMASHLNLEELFTHDEFDAHTDIHVFMLSATRRRITARRTTAGHELWWPQNRSGECLADHFDVRVGSVVDNRDPHEGPPVPYLKARGLPASGQVGIPTRVRRFSGRLVAPPFVAIRRTSRPGQGAGGEARGVGVLVAGDTPVAVDNHIITARPLDGSDDSCRYLLKVLASPIVASWLDNRIRCRHLTVRAVREIPWAVL